MQAVTVLERKAGRHAKGNSQVGTSELEEGLSYFQVILNPGHLC